MVELEKRSIYCKNFFGVKSYLEVDILLENEEANIIVSKEWDGHYCKFKFNEKDKCYEVVDEIFK